MMAMEVVAGSVSPGAAVDLRCPTPRPERPTGTCNRLLLQVVRPTAGTIVTWCPRCRSRWEFLVAVTT